MLDDGSGQLVELTETLNSGSPVVYTDEDGVVHNSLNANWTLRDIDDVNNISLVAFIQGKISKVIYQSSSVDITGKADIVTGIGDDLLLGEQKMRVYPNPADQHIVIAYPQKSVEDLRWAIYDQTGRIFKQGTTIKGFEGFEVDTIDFPEGLYFVSVIGEKTKFQNKKLMIIH